MGSEAPEVLHPTDSTVEGDGSLLQIPTTAMITVPHLTDGAVERDGSRLQISATATGKTSRSKEPVPHLTDGAVERDGSRLQISTTTTGKTSKSKDLAQTSTNQPVMLTSFADAKLLRASSSRVLLSRCGKIFSESTGSAETYQLSRPTTRIRWFVSHNWSTPRMKKFAVLALTFNFYPAVLVTSIAMMSVLVLTSYGALPLVEESASQDDGRIGITAQLVCPAIFLIALFTWQEIASVLGLLNTNVFLDKTCIHQVDEDLKREGIMSLAAFLGKTDGMLVLYTSTYLRRLWTVFELASLVILYPEKELKVVPVFFARFAVGGLLAGSVYMAIFQLARSEVAGVDLGGWGLQMNVVLNMAAALVFAFVSLIWARRKEEMRTSIMNFRMSDAACMDETDRRLVRKSVETFMKRRKFVEESTSRPDTLLAFEKMIQKDVTPRLMRELGLQGIPYKYIVIIWAPRLFRAVDLVGASVHDAVEPRVIVFIVINQVCTVFFVIPTLLAFTSLLMQRSVGLKGWRSAAVVLGASLALTVASFATVIGMTRARDMANESIPGIACLLLFQLAFVGLLWVSHHWLPRRLNA